jgi:hypothetical protein
MDLAYADAVKAHDRSTATADHDAAVDYATAAKNFYVNLATPASNYARDLAAAQAIHSIEVAICDNNSKRPPKRWQSGQQTRTNLGCFTSPRNTEYRGTDQRLDAR